MWLLVFATIWVLFLAVLIVLIASYFLIDWLIFRIKLAVKIHKAKRAAKKFFKIYNKMMDRSGMPRINKEQKEMIIKQFIAIHTGQVPVASNLKDYFDIR